VRVFGCVRGAHKNFWEKCFGRPADRPGAYAVQYGETVQILKAISNEEANTRVLARADLKDLYRDALHWSR